ncbi:MAG TPA: methylated-DNA--[protein]-cysteine S-methyltransferase [Beijerinckiaceae bacterium]|jgi:methylated-DNA-[protein]-cysteine S-methyltransferase|nr:methylated-DNA--[protein]-cysteine S-methyltransferase [Beijerinckiaceae bacterium]
MTDHGFALFETAVGLCGVAWGRDGILGVQLPEGDATRTRARLRRRFPDAREAEPPDSVRAAIAAIQALLAGEPRDLSEVALDWTGVGAFERRVYEVARAIPPGATLTYGEVAARIGETALAARDVGQALGRNPFPIVVPCHRVIAAGGKSGGFSARGGAATKLKLLRIEGAEAAGPPTLFD